MKKPMRLAVIAALVGMLFIPLVASATDLDALGPVAADPLFEPQDAGLTTDGAPAEALEPVAMKATPWGTPVQVSPNNGTALYHFPRKTTLAWLPVTGAVKYYVERAYLSGGNWVAYPGVYVYGFTNSSYTFDFVGDQAGRWRVRAYNGSVYSSVSPWWTFSYNTVPQMATPIQMNPYPDEVFDHFPRTVTLAWKMLPGVAGYKLERQYCSPDKVTCWDYPVVTIANPLQSFYTFTFAGMQPGKWRVTALGASPSSRDSYPSAWRWFSFTR